jgi:hypothetical protein
MQNGDENVKIVMKFKDGLVSETELNEDFTINGSENLIEMLRTGKKNNATITLNDSIVKHYDELYSVEIVM